MDELDLLRFSLELVALLFARLVDDEVGLRRLPVEAPNAREGVDRGAEDLVSVDLMLCNLLSHILNIKAQYQKKHSPNLDFIFSFMTEIYASETVADNLLSLPKVAVDLLTALGVPTLLLPPMTAPLPVRLSDRVLDDLEPFVAADSLFLLRLDMGFRSAVDPLVLLNNLRLSMGAT